MSRSIQQTDQHIRDSIEALLTRQDSNGSFGLWSVGGNDVWLDSYVTDFLSRARERKYAVPDEAFKLALNRLRNAVAATTDAGKNGGDDIAYALYVLARNGAAPIGDLRYLADAKLDALSTPIAKAQIAAALAMVGDRARAERVYAAALASIAPQPQPDLFGREDYGSTLRDAAALVALAVEGDAPRATVQAAVQRVGAAYAASRYLSTQEEAWLLLAARALAKNGGGLALDVNGEARQRPFSRTIRAADLTAPLRITNNGDAAVDGVVTVTGAPVTPEPAAEKGFKIERETFTLAGDPVDAKSVKQNTRLAVVLKITEAQPQFGRVIVADYLPAGIRDRQSAHRLVGRHRNLVVDHRRGRAGVVRVSRRPLHRGVRAQERRPRGVHRRLCGARGRARHIRAAAGERRGHVPPRPLRPHRDGKRGSHGEMTGNDE